jgi:hypothetical protein
MDNDAWLIVGIIAFLFILWFYTGGPNKPISFSGPYITPIANINTKQVGYGKPIGTSYLKSANDVPEGTPRTGALNGGRAQFSLVNRDSSGNVHTLKLHTYTSVPVTITGWQLLSTQTGARSPIPAGIIPPAPNRPTQQVPITLSPNQEALVSGGASPSQSSYLDQYGVWHIYLTGFPFRPSGDTIDLLDQFGNPVDRITY